MWTLGTREGARQTDDKRESGSRKPERTEAVTCGTKADKANTGGHGRTREDTADTDGQWSTDTESGGATGTETGTETDTESGTTLAT